MRKLFLTLIAGLLVGLQISSCGGDNNNPPTTVLDISPEGPTIVKRDATQLFSANLDVSWSVAGGDARGTIDANGLYTPPSTIPVDSPVVTILAESDDGQSAEAFVDLRAADNLTVTDRLPLNDSDISFSTFTQGLGVAPNADRFDAKLGSVQLHAVWAGSGPNVYYSHSMDLLDFSPEEVLFPTSSGKIPASLLIDADLNPVLTLSDDSSGSPRLFFVRSDDQGLTFDDPVPLQPDNPGFEQNGGILARDELGILHAVFSELDTSVLNGATNVYYVRSEDGGANWSEPEPLSASINDTEPNVLPYLAVSPDGQKVAACWNRSSPSPENVYFSHSANGGQSFSVGEPLTGDGQSATCRVALGPNGEIYVSYAEETGLDDSNVWVRKSTDGGENFGGAVQANTNAINNSNTLASLAVDDLGRVDVVFSADPDNTTRLTHIIHARSLDGGASFVEQDPLYVSPGPSNLALATGLRHDEAGRMYVEYAEIPGAPVIDLFIVYGQ